MVKFASLLTRLIGKDRPEKKITHSFLEILDDLREKRFTRVQTWLQRTLSDCPESIELPQLLDEAHAAGWRGSELAKLEAFAFYYRGELHAAYSRACPYAIVPNFDGDLFIIAAFSLYHLCRYEEAYRLIESLGDNELLLDGRSDFAITAALISWSANKIDATKRYIDRAWSLAPNDPVVALNAYSIYFELGDTKSFLEVKMAFDEGGYDVEQAGFALAIIELAQDRYAEGFRLLELRYKMREASRYLNSGLFDRPRWQGEPLGGKTLLVSAEQGLGDTIQFVRFLSQINELGGRVVMEVQPEALSLLKFNFPNIDIVIRDYAKAPILKFDMWVGMMSLPHLLGIAENDVPGRAGYITAPPDVSDYWRRRVAELSRGRRRKIGVAWSGQPAHRADRRRSIPFDKIASGIRGLDVSFFALQLQVPELRPANLIDLSEEMVTLADTAALIAEMDLVITVDTSIVHLAGALGKQVLLMLPYRYEWRWSLEGERNNWYETVKVIRQSLPGNWDSVIEEVWQHRLPSFIGTLQEA